MLINPSERLEIRLADLPISTRTKHALAHDNILTVRDLLGHSEQELLRTPDFGRKGLAQLKQELASLGFQLTPFGEAKPLPSSFGLDFDFIHCDMT